MVEFEQEVEFEVSMEVLQFVGISDHTQLHNRELANQHPIDAITGLNDYLIKQDEEITKTMQGVMTCNEILETHEKTLLSHGEKIESDEQTLETHTVAIEELERFSQNIATTEDTKEVLKNGE